MQKAVRRFLFSLLLVLLTFITVTATTFAWLSLALKNYVNTINFSVTSGADFYLSIGDSTKESIDQIDNWSNTLYAEDLEDYIKNVKIANITSTDGVNFYRRDGKKAETETYIRIPLYIKVENAPEQFGIFPNIAMYLSDYNQNANYDDARNGVEKGTFIVSKGITQYADCDYYSRDGEFLIANVSKDTYYAMDTIRLSIANVEYDDIKMDNSDDISNSQIFDLSNDPQYGYANASDEIYATPRGCISYEMSKLASATVDLPESSPDTVKLHDDPSEKYLFDLHPVMENDKKVFYGKCYLFIWLEGWDIDCYDVVIRDYLYGNISFMIKNY